MRRKVWLVGYLRRIWSFDLGKEDPLMSTPGVAETFDYRLQTPECDRRQVNSIVLITW